MTTQIAVRLPDDLVAYLDRTVASGEAASRAAIVSAALEREMRHRAAMADARVLREICPEDDLDALVDWTAAPAVTVD